MKNLKILKCTIAVAACAMAWESHGQRPNPDDLQPRPFTRKFYATLSYHNYWATFKGDNLAQEYFSKPALGTSLRLDYYILSSVGVSAGIGYQQAGAGVRTGTNYNERLRFNMVEFPLGVVLRTPFYVIPGVKLSARAGVTPQVNAKSVRVVLSPDDGLHTVTDESENFMKKDLVQEFAAGVDINSGGSGILQVQFVYEKGTKNVYASTYSGTNQSMGFRVSWQFGISKKSSQK